jgi:hypothetical protein
MGTPKGVVDGMITSNSVGPGQAWVRFTGICETLLVACIIPVEQDQLQVVYCYTQSKAQTEGPMAGLARAIIKDVNKQLDQDKVVWDRMRYRTQSDHLRWRWSGPAFPQVLFALLRGGRRRAVIAAAGQLRWRRGAKWWPAALQQ